MQLSNTIILIAVLACSAANAETLTTRDAADPTACPTAVDVVAQLYQFDLFQQNSVDTADTAMNTDISSTATMRAEAATTRDKALSDVEQKAGLNVPLQKANTALAHSSLGVDRTEGTAYVRDFYQMQLAQYELAVSTLERYLEAPDNDEVRRFAESQLPALRSEMTDTKSALADK
jgi:hypothetical protein